MLEATIMSIKMLATADPETDAATVARIVAACKAKRPKSDLISARMAADILGVSRQTIYTYTVSGKLHPVRHSKRMVRYDRNEVETFANNGIE